MSGGSPDRRVRIGFQERLRDREYTTIRFAQRHRAFGDPKRALAAKVFCVARFLFDHLVGAQQNRLRHSKAECLGGLEVDDKLLLGRDLDTQVHRSIARTEGMPRCARTVKASALTWTPSLRRDTVRGVSPSSHSWRPTRLA
jgi:hypothetical protein